MTAGEHKKTETNWENVFANEREREREKKRGLWTHKFGYACLLRGFQKA